MWSTIVVGMFAGLVGELIGVKLGISNWGSIQISFYLYFALIVYSIWKLTFELKKRRD
ncbi:putative membrane protein [Desulfosporosinus sp. OT]|nr:putative membrane protein [Desulfosporosinus sp. OT]